MWSPILPRRGHHSPPLSLGRRGTGHPGKEEQRPRRQSRRRSAQAGASGCRHLLARLLTQWDVAGPPARCNLVPGGSPRSHWLGLPGPLRPWEEGAHLTAFPRSRGCEGCLPAPLCAVGVPCAPRAELASVPTALGHWLPPLLTATGVGLSERPCLWGSSHPRWRAEQTGPEPGGPRL